MSASSPAQSPLPRRGAAVGSTQLLFSPSFRVEEALSQPMFVEHVPSVGDVQRSIKSQSQTLVEDVELVRDQVQQLQRDVQFQTRENYIVDKEVQTLDLKIGLIIRNLIKAEDLKGLLSHSLRDVKDAVPQTSQVAERFRLYENIFFVLQRSPQYMASLVQFVSGRDVQRMLQTVVLTLFGDQYDSKEERLLLTMFEMLMMQEFERCPRRTDFMRTNTIFTKMLNVFFNRRMCREYLTDTLSQPLQELVAQGELDLEIRPSTLYRGLREAAQREGRPLPGPESLEDGEAAEIPAVRAIMEERFRLIQEHTQLIVDRIMASVHRVPYGLRFLCKKILEYGATFYPDIEERERWGLVGGLAFLRFITPAISSPQTKDLLRPESVTEVMQRNFIIIGKLVQNLSNGVTYGGKEAYMTPLNVFFERNGSRVTAFFQELCNVEELQGRMEVDRYLESTRRDSNVISISLNEVFMIHRLLLEHIGSIAPDPTDELSTLVTQLRAQGDPPLDVPPEENNFFNLRLVPPFESSPAPETESVHQHQPLSAFETVCSGVVSVLRHLPEVPAQISGLSLLTVLQTGKLNAIQTEDYLLADKIKRLSESILALTDDIVPPVVCGDARVPVDQCILCHVQSTIEARVQIMQALTARMRMLQSVLAELREHGSFLMGQRHFFEEYLANIRKKAYNPRDVSSRNTGAVRVVGPFNYALSKMETEGVVTAVTLPTDVAKRTQLCFSSMEPGVFTLLLQHRKKPLMEKQLDFSYLLERQQQGETVVELAEVQLDLSLLIHLLNKLFVLQ